MSWSSWSRARDFSSFRAAKECSFKTLTYFGLHFFRSYAFSSLMNCCPWQEQDKQRSWAVLLSVSSVSPTFPFCLISEPISFCCYFLQTKRPERPWMLLLTSSQVSLTSRLKLPLTVLVLSSYIVLFWYLPSVMYFVPCWYTFINRIRAHLGSPAWWHASHSNTTLLLKFFGILCNNNSQNFYFWKPHKSPLHFFLQNLKSWDLYFHVRSPHAHILTLSLKETRFYLFVS